MQPKTIDLPLGLYVNTVAIVDSSGNAVGSGSPLAITTGQITSAIATIANAASLSGDIDMGTGRLAQIIIPAAWTAADITLQASFDNVTWSNLYDKEAVEYEIKVAAGRAVLVPLADMLSVRYIRIRSGTSATPVPQGASRTITLVMVP